MTDQPYVMSDEEKYFFDLTGYLVVPGALTREQVDECNRAIDHFSARIAVLPTGRTSGNSATLSGEKGRQELEGMLGWEPPYCEPFRRLLVHPIVVSRLNDICGKRFRLDHGPLLIGADKGTEGHRLHGGGEPHVASGWYHQQNEQIFCRAVTVAWQLHDVRNGDGGFAIVPGSHKSRFPAPKGVLSADANMGLVVQPAMSAGDVLFFAEVATHGTLPWESDRPRRSILYKYASRSAARWGGKCFKPEDRYGEWTKQLTPEQHSLLYGPGGWTGSNRPALEPDGVNVRTSDR